MAKDLNELLISLTPAPMPADAAPINTPHSTLLFKMERIKLPKVGGDPSKWTNFKNILESLVNDDPSTPKVQKFHLLRAVLEAEAFGLIENIMVAEENYNSAWNMLKNRDEDECGLIWTLLKALFSIKRIKGESFEEARRLYDQTSRACEQLAKIGRKVDQRDHLLIYFLVNKMDAETRKHNELYSDSATTFLTLDQIKVFLADRARLPSTASTTKTTQRYSAKAHLASTETKVVCPAFQQLHSLTFHFQVDVYKG